MTLRGFAHRPLALGFAIAALITPADALAQIISPKTVPVAEGDQFLIHPSLRLGMGSVSIALDDPYADPFSNPATGASLESSVLFAAPTHYNVTDGDGNGITLPLGGLWSGREWFGALAVALQEITSPARPWGFGWFDVMPGPLPQSLRQRSANNLYGSASLGRRLNGGATAVAAGFSYASLQALDGVDLLYAGSRSIHQDGHTADLRLGLVHEMSDGGSLEFLTLHNRFDMMHEVTYVDWQMDTVTYAWAATERVERNPDRTDTWGVQVAYDRPIGGSGWRAGGVLTGNYKDHPKIPNYQVMNIPRDPGHTWAYNIGAGVALDEGPIDAGVDVVLEPMWSSTWADAEARITTPSGSTIPAGGKTVENEFVFRNAIVRTGVGRETERYGIQLGLQARSISYTLDQRDHVAELDRRQRESWTEWTPTWAAALRFPELELRYTGRLTTGTGQPGTQMEFAMADVRLGSTFIPAPSGPLTLRDANVVTHRLMVTIPVR